MLVSVNDCPALLCTVRFWLVLFPSPISTIRSFDPPSIVIYRRIHSISKERSQTLIATPHSHVLRGYHRIYLLTPSNIVDISSLENFVDWLLEASVNLASNSLVAFFEEYIVTDQCEFLGAK
jgi:hypothetical protein